MEDSYFAGIFDGEGYVGIQRNKHGYHIECLVRTAGKTLPELLYKEFGGCLRSNTIKTGRYRIIWTWQANGEIAYKFLKRMDCYSILKRPQINMAMAFQERLRANHNHGRKRLTDEEHEYRMSLIKQMSNLKELSYVH